MIMSIPYCGIELMSININSIPTIKSPIHIFLLCFMYNVVYILLCRNPMVLRIIMINKFLKAAMLIVIFLNLCRKSQTLHTHKIILLGPMKTFQTYFCCFKNMIGFKILLKSPKVKSQDVALPLKQDITNQFLMKFWKVKILFVNKCHL